VSVCGTVLGMGRGECNVVTLCGTGLGMVRGE